MHNYGQRLAEEIERAREQMNAAIERRRLDAHRERAEFEEMMAEFKRAGGPRDWSLPESWTPGRKRRRPPRKPRGGEPAPVKPRPNPMPLTDGAEAPLD
jgi:hypothetical protein